MTKPICKCPKCSGTGQIKLPSSLKPVLAALTHEWKKAPEIRAVTVAKGSGESHGATNNRLSRLKAFNLAESKKVGAVTYWRIKSS